MNLVHLIPHINEEASGPSYSVPRLCTALSLHNCTVELMCLAGRNDVVGVDVRVFSQWPILRRFAVSPGLVRTLLRRAAEVDIVHNHGLWSMMNCASGIVVPSRGAKLVTSPRGTLSPRAMAIRAREKVVMWPIQRLAVDRAELLHSTCDSEYEDIRARGIRRPVAIISNGIDVPAVVNRTVAAEGVVPKTLLFLSRLHPIKGIEQLLEAWRELESRHTDWRLVIAGCGEPYYVKSLCDLVMAYRLRRVTFPGVLYGTEKSSAYSHADLFVLPSHSENFGMVVAEALAYGCPVVVGRGAPWEGVVREGCGWWVSNDIPSIHTALDRAMRLSSSERALMGLRGRAWMIREFGWQSVSERMYLVYQWLMYGGQCPPWVRLD